MNEEPSTKARELVEAFREDLLDCYLDRNDGSPADESESALLTYIADLERRAHPEGEVREALD